MIHLGLIGYPLSHSWSADYFNEKFRNTGKKGYEYRLFPLTDIGQFPALLSNNPQLMGLNVTIPFKERIIPFLDELDPTAREIGAVNTIVIERDNGLIRTKGFNTDAGGFYITLKDQIKQCNALILGTGGASKAVAFALGKLQIPCSFVSRTKTGPNIHSYNKLTVELIYSNKLIINTTPLGMYPELTLFPDIPYQGITKDHLLYDLIYNPEETHFLKQGRYMNARTMNGRNMLINQAELAYRIFQG
jgi:shikimate dehydrogenase